MGGEREGGGERERERASDEDTIYLCLLSELSV